MSPLRIVYLLLAVLGAALPMYLFFSWLGTHGFDPSGLIQSWMVNAAAAGLAWDLMVSATALSIFILAEVSVRHGWWVRVCIPATFCIGVSCGLPIYLFLRTRALR